MSLHLFDDPKKLLLDMAQVQSVPELLRLIVTRVANPEKVALARIWLAHPTTTCRDCTMPETCRGQSECLHLMASSGRSLRPPYTEWKRTDGAFRRLSSGIRKIGKVFATAQPLEVLDFGVESPNWMFHPDWAIAEKVRGFAAQPLVHRGRSIGVLAVFARQTIGDACIGWLRMVADHAAAAIVTARAIAEIESLRKRLEQENEYLREEVTGGGAFGELVGQSPALEAVARQIDMVAPTESTVLILGESGTGKELVAREIHRRSRRAGRPLIKVNCAAVPRELYESEFFGHAKGAFTGALRDRTGRFELAENGTLFLDEIGEIPLELQAKLLRVVQEGELERVGEERTRRVNVRLVAATYRDLRAEAEAGRFRQDLFYRLSVFPIDLPPLRKRKEDIALLADHFLGSSARKAGRPRLPLTTANVQRLQAYDWPGNVRELQHVLERGGTDHVDGKPAPCGAADRGTGEGREDRSRSGGRADRVGDAPVRSGQHPGGAEGGRGQDLWPRRRGEAAQHEADDAGVADQGSRDTVTTVPIQRTDAASFREVAGLRRLSTTIADLHLRSRSADRAGDAHRPLRSRSRMGPIDEHGPSPAARRPRCRHPGPWLASPARAIGGSGDVRRLHGWFSSRGSERGCITPDLVRSMPGPVTLIVPDGNWNQATNMMRRVPALQEATAVRLDGETQLTEPLRHNPDANRRSTFEAIARAVGILEGEETETRMLEFFREVLARRTGVETIRGR